MAARLTTYVVVGIVAATLIAGLIAGAQRDDYDGPVDLIVQNGRVFTGEASGTRAEAIAVRGNRVLRVGSNRDINRMRRPQTIVVDANGGSVLPGFNDSHVHFIAGGLALEHVDLRDALEISAIEQRIRTWAEANADAPWVIGRGWTYAAFPDGGPKRQTLDDIVADRPAFLLSTDGSAVWVNSRALAMAARMTRAARVAPTPAAVKDSRTGEPAGVLKGAAIAQMAALLPEAEHYNRDRALRRAIKEAHRNGITSVHDAGADVADLGVYEDALKDGELDIRVHSAVRVAAPLTEDDLERLDEIRTKHRDDPLLKTGALKIWVDGATDPRTAAPPIHPAVQPDELKEMVRLADAHGWQVMAHATRESAVRMTLDAFQQAAESNLAPARGRRHRIEHAEAIDPADIRRFGALGVVASVQPHSAARHDARTGAAAIEREPASPPEYERIAEAGGRVTFGSDWPRGSMNPLAGVHAAVARSAKREPDEGNSRAERAALDAALEAYTSTPAWASFDDQRKGTLAPGMLADIVVLSEDIFEMPATKLAAAKVDVTIFDGKIVYRRGATATD